MGATPILALPFPEPSDPADVPTDMHELALATEDAITGTNKPLPVSVIDAQGDLIVGTGPDAATRLAPGPNLAVLVRDDTAPNKVAWSSGGAGTPPVVPIANFPPANPTDGQELMLKLADGTFWHLKYDPSAPDAYKWRFVGGPPVQAFDTQNATGTNLNGPTVPLPRPGVYDVEGYASAAPPAGASFQLHAGYSSGTLLLAGTQTGTATGVVFMASAGANRGTFAAAGTLQLWIQAQINATQARALKAWPVRLS